MRTQQRANALMLTVLLLWTSSGLCDGQIDTTWAGGGRIAFAADTHNPTHGSELHRVTVQANGNLLMGGIVFGPGMSLYWWLGQWTADGSPIATFGEGNGSGLVTGCWLSPALCGGYFGGGRAVQNDGRIVLVSDAIITRTAPGAHALDVAGVVGGTGMASLALVVNDAMGMMDRGSAIAPLPSGKWIVAGSGRYDAMSGGTHIAVVRLNADFSLDTSFNVATDNNGVSFAGGQIVAIPGLSSTAFNVVLEDDGRILLHANAFPTDGGASLGAMVRLHADGSLDTSFGTNGVAMFPHCGFFMNTVHMDRAGRTLASCLGGGMKLIRILAEGTPDSAFGMSGVAFLHPPSMMCSGGPILLRPTTDSAGRVLAAGLCPSLTDNDADGAIDPDQFVVVRLHGDDGSLDPSFGTDGYVFGQFADDSTADGAYAVAMDGSGRPLVNGYTTRGMGQVRQSALARLGYDLSFSDGFETVPRGRLHPR